MGWSMLKERSGDSDVSDFKKAANMAKKGLEIMCEIAADMADEYDEFSERDSDWDDDEPHVKERRRRRSNGRFM